MRAIVSKIALLAIGVLALQPLQALQAPTPDAVVAALSAEDATQKERGLVWLDRWPALLDDHAVADTVLRELRIAGARETERMTRMARGDAGGPQQGPILLGLVMAAVRLDRPDVLEALVPHVGYSSLAISKVATFGSRAVPMLRDLYRDGRGAGDPANIRLGVLLALSRISKEGAVTADQRPAVLAIARQAIASSEAPQLVGACRLAVAIGDSDLLAQVRRLATGDFGARTVMPSERQWVQTSAAEALKGGS
jgi:hypothetical protein